jgi:hydroxymethylglutaryl-CoA lyase/(R)-citramalyl-CoA lyase
VRIVEVGPRDGLQNAPRRLHPRRRAGLIKRLAGAGVPWIEATSFVNPRFVPQMADAEQVVAGLPQVEGVRYCGLVLNERGLDRLLATELNAVRFTFAVSDSFNRRNANASTEAGLEWTIRGIERAREAGLYAGVVLGTAFGCPYTGEVDPSLPLGYAEQLTQAGAEEIVFADTIGAAVPRQVRELIRGAADLGPPIGVHLHNTRNTGYVNAYTAVAEGAEILDASIGGLGGCPFAPSATGNIATEDLVFMLEREGIDTGVDLAALLATADWLKDVAGLALDGQVHRAGVFPRPHGAVAA